MLYEFNKEETSRDLYGYMGKEAVGYLPQGVKLNEYPERIELLEL